MHWSSDLYQPHRYGTSLTSLQCGINCCIFIYRSPEKKLINRIKLGGLGLGITGWSWSVELGWRSRLGLVVADRTMHQSQHIQQHQNLHHNDNKMKHQWTRLLLCNMAKIMTLPIIISFQHNSRLHGCNIFCETSVINALPLITIFLRISPHYVSILEVFKLWWLRLYSLCEKLKHMTTVSLSTLCKHW